MSIKEKYDNLSPKSKKGVLWGGGGFLLVLALYLFTSTPEQKNTVKQENNKPSSNLITSGDTQGVSQESIAADLRRIEDQLAKMEHQRVADQKEISDLNRKQTRLEKENNELNFKLNNQQSYVIPTPAATPKTPKVQEKQKLQDIYSQNNIPYSTNQMRDGNRLQKNENVKDETHSDNFAKEEDYPEIMRFDGDTDDSVEQKKRLKISQKATQKTVMKKSLKAHIYPQPQSYPLLPYQGWMRQRQSKPVKTHTRCCCA